MAASLVEGWLAPEGVTGAERVTVSAEHEAFNNSVTSTVNELQTTVDSMQVLLQEPPGHMESSLKEIMADMPTFMEDAVGRMEVAVKAARHVPPKPHNYLSSQEALMPGVNRNASLDKRGPEWVHSSQVRGNWPNELIFDAPFLEKLQKAKPIGQQPAPVQPAPVQPAPITVGPNATALDRMSVASPSYQ